MKGIKRTSIYSILIGLISITFFACSSETSQETNQEAAEFDLFSPSGKILANDSNELIQLIANNSEQVQASDIVLEQISYSENEKYSIAIVNFISSDDNFSALIPIEINDDYMQLVDQKNVRFVKNIGSEQFVFEDNADVLKVKPTTTTSAQTRGTVLVCNGGCCGWSQPEPDHYNCGCDGSRSARNTTVSTSDGCRIQVIENK